jgi:hypothetical protein
MYVKNIFVTVLWFRYLEKREVISSAAKGLKLDAGQNAHIAAGDNWQ